MDAVLYDLVSKKNWVCEEFLVGGNFTAKSEIAFLEGCGGGSSGESAGSSGGGAGAGCQWFPVKLSIGEVVSVTIGAGGTGSLGSGGATTFGSYLTLPGGSTSNGGAPMQGTSLSDYKHALPVGFIIKGAHGGASSENGFRSTFSGGTASGSYCGGGGGFYGTGGNGNNAGAGGAAAANSGAGGGAGSTTGGAGGSGRLRVYYFK